MQKSHKIRTFGLSILAGAMMFAGSALAQDSVTVATEASFPPFSKTEADGSYTGFEIDLGNAVCEEAGLECTWVKQAFDGMIAALLAEKFDFVFSSMSITEERKKVVDFSIPYYKVPSKFVAAEGSDIEISKDGLAGKTVGVYAGATQDDYMQAHHPEAEIKGYENIDQIAADLKIGRVDLMFVESVPAQEFLDSEAGEGFAFVGPDIYDSETLGEGVGAMFRQDQDQLRERISKAIRAVYADGTFDEIADRYFKVSIRADSAW